MGLAAMGLALADAAGDPRRGRGRSGSGGRGPSRARSRGPRARSRGIAGLRRAGIGGLLGRGSPGRGLAGRGLEGALEGEALVEGDAEGLDVGAAVEADRAAQELLGGHVGRGAEESPVRVRVGRSASSRRARPKSRITGSPSGVIMMLPGLMSRWMTPASWAAWRARAALSKMLGRSRTSSRRGSSGPAGSGDRWSDRASPARSSVRRVGTDAPGCPVAGLASLATLRNHSGEGSPST